MDGLTATYLFKNRNKLATAIKITDGLIKNLQAYKTLVQADVIHLENCGRFGSKFVVTELLRILALRENGLQDLMCALNSDQQFYAASLLQPDEWECKTRPQLVRIFGCRILPIKRGPFNRDEYDYFERKIFGLCLSRAIKSNKSVDLLPEFLKVFNLFVDQFLQICLAFILLYERIRDISEKVVKFTGIGNKPAIPCTFSVPNTKACYYYDPLNPLGKGTTADVFLGYWNNDPNLKVAVKYVYKNANVVSTAELNMAKEIWSTKSTKTYHLVPILDWSEQKNVYFIIMELAASILDDAITKNLYDIKTNKKMVLSLLQNCVDGLHWLHQDKNTIHRDIKPHNILLYKYDDNIVAKLADFGVCRNLKEESGIYSYGRGTERWMSPEALSAISNETDFKNTKMMDIFSLGMVFYYCLSGGYHPFEFNSKVISNIKNMTISAQPLPQTDLASSNDLIRWMMQKGPKLRPNISQVRDHPMFWEDEKCLNFLEDISRCVNNKEPGSECLEVRKCLDEWYKSYNTKQHGKEFKWMPFVDKRFFQRRNKWRGKRYDEKSVVSLVELIRDKAEHYQDMVKGLRMELF